MFTVEIVERSSPMLAILTEIANLIDVEVLNALPLSMISVEIDIFQDNRLYANLRFLSEFLKSQRERPKTESLINHGFGISCDCSLSDRHSRTWFIAIAARCLCQFSLHFQL